MAKVKTSEQQKSEMFLALIAKNMKLCGYRQKSDLALPMHMSVPTLYSRLKNIENFNLAELRRIFNLLNFSEEEIKLII